MSYVFHIDAKNKKVINPEATRLCPELSVLSEEEILYVILTYDYFSPFNQFPVEERSRKAQVLVWGDLKNEIVAKEKIKKAGIAYESLQYDPKRNLISTYQKKIDSLRGKLETEDGPTGIKNIMQAISELRKSITELEKEVADEVVKIGMLKADKKLSWLEMYQRNMPMYESMRKNKEKPVSNGK